MDILSSTANSIFQSHIKTIKTPLALPTHHFSLEETIAAPLSLSLNEHFGAICSRTYVHATPLLSLLHGRPGGLVSVTETRDLREFSGQDHPYPTPRVGLCTWFYINDRPHEIFWSPRRRATWHCLRPPLDLAVAPWSATCWSRSHCRCIHRAFYSCFLFTFFSIYLALTPIRAWGIMDGR